MVDELDGEPEGEIDEEPSGEPAEPSPVAPQGEAFPTLLHGAVSDESTDDCVRWLPGGTKFVVCDKAKFARDVLPKICGRSKFASFASRLKRWSFDRVSRGEDLGARVSRGEDLGAYYHEHFRRDEPRRASRVRYRRPTPLSAGALRRLEPTDDRARARTAEDEASQFTEFSKPMGILSGNEML
ncbi:hypothetical protein ACHAWF_000397, partial [Thalassiosira exigua]